jgi:hypothetical protein
MDFEEAKAGNDCAGEDQQQFHRQTKEELIRRKPPVVK